MIQLAIVDDHQMFLEGLKSLITGFEEMTVTMEANNGREFIQKLTNTKVDIALLDLEMPELNGIETMEELKKINSGVKVIVVSANKEPKLISNLMELGARGYLLKDANALELKTAILSINETGYYFNDLVTQSLLVKLARGKDVKPDFFVEELSDREKEVLRLICEEFTTSEIAEKLFLSPRTVESHRERIMSKTGARNLAGMVVYAVKNKIIHVG